jgi:hypothetical protein
MACGHLPLLVARSYPRKVTLKWVNPDTNCNAEAVRAVPVRIRLTAPLGNRALVQAVSGGPVRYFDERDLASLGALPAGYRLTSDLPSVSFPGNDQPWVVGDTRIYTGPAGTGTLTIAQLVGARGIIPLTPWPWPGHVLVHGRVAALRVDQAGRVFLQHLLGGARLPLRREQPRTGAAERCATHGGGERDTAAAWSRPIGMIWSRSCIGLFVPKPTCSKTDLGGAACGSVAVSAVGCAGP